LHHDGRLNWRRSCWHYCWRHHYGSYDRGCHYRRSYYRLARLDCRACIAQHGQLVAQAMQLSPHFFLHSVSAVQFGLHGRQFLGQVPDPSEQDDGDNKGNHGCFHAQGKFTGWVISR
jgi:hypothetical protein